jgi:hypothetical protein
VFEIVKFRSALSPSATLPKLRLDELRAHAGDAGGVGEVGAEVFFEQLSVSTTAKSIAAPATNREERMVDLAGAGSHQ